MRAIVIDPFEQRVLETEVEPTLDGVAELIGCEEPEIGMLPTDHCMYVSADVGMSRLADTFFAWGGEVFAGRGVILGTDEETGASPCTLTVEDVQEQVRWAYPVLASDGVRFAVEVKL